MQRGDVVPVAHFNLLCKYFTFQRVCHFVKPSINTFVLSSSNSHQNMTCSVVIIDISFYRYTLALVE